LSEAEQIRTLTHREFTEKNSEVPRSRGGSLGKALLFGKGEQKGGEVVH
jgi:hypothetical protein